MNDTCVAALVYAVIITSAEGTNVGTARFVAMREHRRAVPGGQTRRNGGGYGSLLEVAKIEHLLLHRFGTPDGGMHGFADAARLTISRGKSDRGSCCWEERGAH